VDDDTWEPRESLLGGAEGVLETYQKRKTAKGVVFHEEGIKIAKDPVLREELAAQIRGDKPGTSSTVANSNGNGNASTSSKPTSSRRERVTQDDDIEEIAQPPQKKRKSTSGGGSKYESHHFHEDTERDAEEAKRKKRESAIEAKLAAQEAETERMKNELADIEARAEQAERKRKRRESQAAAAAQAQQEEEEQQEAAERERARKKNRKSQAAREEQEEHEQQQILASDEGLPVPVFSRRDKENDGASSGKPSSKQRSTRDEEPTSTATMSSKKRAYVSQESDEDDDEADAREVVDQIKRSPLKEKKATDQATESSSSRKKSTSQELSNKKDVVMATIKDSIVDPVQSAISKALKLDEEEADAKRKEGGGLGADADADEEDGLIFGSEFYKNKKSWEDYLSVDSLEQDITTGQYKWLVTWNPSTSDLDLKKTAGQELLEFQDEWIPNTLAKKMFPQRLLAFYEDHLKFKSGPDDDGAPIGDGDDIAMEQD
jgi:hypothetical protein